MNIIALLLSSLIITYTAKNTQIESNVKCISIIVMSIVGLMGLFM